jgi:mRNA-degrading endonuclease RelE of RelBE toxin-antitoxin system
VKRTITLSPDARTQLQRLRAAERAALRQALETQLGKDDATVPTKNRFRLRRPSSLADYELRVGRLRVFYRVEGKIVRVILIGKKHRDAVLIDGKRFTL